MKRYLCGFDTEAMERIKTDVLIVGSGLAGLYAALNIDPKLSCTIVTKTELEKTNSWLAQGGIAAVIAPDDHFESHIADTLEAGAGLCDEKAVQVLVEEGPENIKELVALDVPFDTNPEGELQITREGGHSCRRIVHCGGDATGRETTRRLGELALERKNVSVRFRSFLMDVLTEDGAVVGAIIYDGEPKLVLTRNVILATGGVGHIYRYTTNPRGAVGDGIAAAMRAGAETELMEMVQFHPTTLISNGQDKSRLFLISEAVRGEGAILRNFKGEAFMQGVHRRADLAPRDIVTRAILKELRRTGDPHAWLDVSSMDEAFFARRFPTIYGRCVDEGIRLTKEPIPVHPAQHYFMGGIKTDLDGETNIHGLFAAGESACTGIHGANRLASNSMLECLVFSRRAARLINRRAELAPSGISRIKAAERGTRILKRTESASLHEKIRTVMSRDCSALRTPEGLQNAVREIGRIYETLQDAVLRIPDEFELYSMAETALKIATSAAARKDSVGAHYLDTEAVTV